MICQAPLHLSAATMLAMLLAACGATPQLDHREVSARLKAGLEANTRHLTKQEQADQRVQVKASIAFNKPVSVPMLLRDDRPHVPARLNGSQPLPFLVDTGSQVCALEARTAVSYQVAILDKAFANPHIVGTTGDESARIGQPDEFAVGSWLLQGFPFVVRTYETHMRLNWWERKNLGSDIIGMDAILKSCNFLTLDFPAQRVVFGTGGRFTPPSGKSVWKAPLLIRKGLPFVQLHTNNRTWTALLDTGFNGVLDMDKATAQRLNLLDKARPSDAFRAGLGAPMENEPTHFGLVFLPRLDSLGPRMVNLPTLIVPERSRSKIGTGLLRPFRVTLDFRRGMLWLEDPEKAL